MDGDSSFYLLFLFLFLFLELRLVTEFFCTTFSSLQLSLPFYLPLSFSHTKPVFVSLSLKHTDIHKSHKYSYTTLSLSLYQTHTPIYIFTSLYHTHTLICKSDKYSYSLTCAHSLTLHEREEEKSDESPHTLPHTQYSLSELKVPLP